MNKDVNNFLLFMQQVISKLPEDPWRWIGQERYQDGFRFEVATVELEKEGCSVAHWRLMSPSGEPLDIFGPDVYQNGQERIGPIGPVGPIGPAGPIGIPDHQSLEVEEDLTIRENGFGIAAAKPILMLDDPEEDVASKQADLDAAFGSTPFFWKDLELAPFAIDREGDWTRHREALQDGPLNELIRLPQAMLPDALRVIWFCAHDPREWLSLPGMVQDDEGAWKRLTQKDKALNLEEKIRAWARDHIDNSEQALAVGLFYDIYNRAQASRAVARPSEHHDATRAKK